MRANCPRFLPAGCATISSTPTVSRRTWISTPRTPSPWSRCRATPCFPTPIPKARTIPPTPNTCATNWSSTSGSAPTACPQLCATSTSRQTKQRRILRYSGAACCASTQRWSYLSLAPPLTRSILPLQQRLPNLLQLLLLGLVHIRELQIQSIQRLDNRRRHRQSRKPFIIRRYHIPRRMLRRRPLHHLFVRFLVVLPELALLDVRHGKFPVFLGIVQPLQKSLLLFLLRDVQEKFPDHHAIARQVMLERIDVLIAFFPDVLGHQRVRQLLRSQKAGMHAHHQHFFIIRAIENSDFPARGRHLVAAPEIIVIQFLVARRLERMHVAALRIHAGHHVFDRAVLAGGVHALKNQQQRPHILRVQLLLHLREHLAALPQHALRVLLRFHSVRVARIKILQPEFFAVCHAIRRRQARRFFDELAIFHKAGSVLHHAASEQRAQPPAERTQAVAQVK